MWNSSLPGNRLLFNMHATEPELGESLMVTVQYNTAQQLNDARMRLKSRLDENQDLMRSASLTGDGQDAAWIRATLERCASKKRRLLSDLDAVIGF